jgi:hypothetical protein
MTAKTMTNAMSKINNFLLYFPDAGVESKYSESDLIGILPFAVPDYYRAASDLRNYIPRDESKTRFIEECECVERSTKPKSHKRDDDGNERKTSKKSSFQNPESQTKKVVQDHLRRIPACIVRIEKLTCIPRQAVTIKKCQG